MLLSKVPWGIHIPTDKPKQCGSAKITIHRVKPLSPSAPALLLSLLYFHVQHLVAAPALSL